MKRGILLALMVLMGICVCACGKRGQDNAETDKPAETEKQTADTVSGQASGTDGEIQISHSEAFAMAEGLLKNMTLEEKIGQMFMLHLSQLDETRTLDGNHYKVTPKIRRMLKKYNIGGIYLTSNNIDNARQTKKLVRSLKNCVSGGALYVAVEEEAGGDYSISAQTDVLREADGLTPEHMGREMSDEQVYEKCRKIAQEIAGYGINMNLAPVSDIASAKNNEYARRCLGSELEGVIEQTESFVRGMSDGGLGTTLKYFPGIGNVSGDYRTQLLENTDSLMTLRNINFATYSAGMEAGADAVMMSSVSVSKVTMKKIPAFMSQEIVTNLLREELGFDGVIMTPFLNDLLMTDKYTSGFAAVEAVKAGCDLLVLPEDWKESYEALLAAVNRGDIDEKVINTAVQRILQNKIQRGILVLEQ